MHHSLLFSSALALLAIAGRLYSADSTTTSSAKNQTIAVLNPPPAMATSGWWGALGTDSLPSDSLQKIPFNMGIMTASDANGREPRKVINALSLTLVSSEAGAVRGLQLSGAMNDVHGSVRGVQGALGANMVGGNVLGVQGAAVNLVKGDVTGIQYGGLFNRVGGNVTGVQMSSLGNLTHGDIVGYQSATVVNRARSVQGVQDGMINLVDDMRGVQTGVVNIADNIKGVQWGFVNIADTMVGPQIGLVNIRPDMKVFVETWTDEVGLGHIGLNYGSPGWYNLLEFAGRSQNSKRGMFGMSFGGRVPSDRLILSLDMGAFLVFNPDQLDNSNSSNDSVSMQMSTSSSGASMELDGPADKVDAINGLFRTRATLGWHLWKRFAIFGGASWNTLIAPDKGLGTKQLRPFGGYHWDADDHVRMWPGAFVGIRF